jgi:hypothetical protein
MKISILLFVSCLCLAACSNKSASSDTSSATGDTTQTDAPIDPAFDPPKMYFNDRFKDVFIKNTGPTAWSAIGKAQIFERMFSWEVENGQKQLLRGIHQVDAAAPEWGNFNFDFNTGPFNADSTLVLVLYEKNPQDGSRTHELKIPLN